MVSCKSTTEEVFFNGHIIGFSPQTQKVRTTLNVSITDSGSTGKGSKIFFGINIEMNRSSVFSFVKFR